MSNRLFKIGFFVVLCLNAALLLRVLSLQSRIDNLVLSEAGHSAETRPYDLAEYLSSPTIPDVAVIDSLGRSISSRELVRGQGPLIVVLFTPGDCSSCFDERDLWAEIPKRAGIPVMAIVANDDVGEFRDWAAGFEFGIPVYIDTNYAVLDSMGVLKRPLKILFDEDGRARWADGTRSSSLSREQYWPDLERELGRL